MKCESLNKPIYVIVAAYFPTPESWNGAFTYDHAKAVERDGRYRVVVIHATYRGTDYNYQGVDVWHQCFDHRASAVLWPLQDRLNYRRFQKCLARHDVAMRDVAVICSSLVFFADVAIHAKRHYSHIISVIHIHDPDPYGCMKGNDHNNTYILKRILCYWHHRRLMEEADVVLSISNNVSKVIREFPHNTVYSTFPEAKRSLDKLRFCRSAQIKRIILLHNGVDMSIFNRDVQTVPHSRFEMGMIGHLWSHWFKDPMTLVYALGKIKDKLGDWRMTFIGTGDCIEKAKMFAKEHGFDERLRFLPNMDHKQLPDFYRGLDLFVMPSYWEGFGCVFTEAYASGVPFITCEGQGMDDLIRPEDRCLWLCKIQDPDDLAEKILYYYENRPKQILAAEIDIDKLVPKYLDELEKLRRA